MSEFKQYRRKAIAELRPVSPDEVGSVELLTNNGVSISQADIDNGSPCALDMIARNPANHNDQWLVAAQYFIDNFEEIEKDSKLGKFLLYSIVNTLMEQGVDFEVRPPYKELIVRDQNGERVLSIDEALNEYGKKERT